MQDLISCTSLLSRKINSFDYRLCITFTKIPNVKTQTLVGELEFTKKVNAQNSFIYKKPLYICNVLGFSDVGDMVVLATKIGWIISIVTYLKKLPNSSPTTKNRHLNFCHHLCLTKICHQQRCCSTIFEQPCVERECNFQRESFLIILIESNKNFIEKICSMSHKIKRQMR